MHHLDTVGRWAPSSLDVSRAAAQRHHHMSALQQRGRPRTALRTPGQPRRWFRLTVNRLRTAGGA
jgi:hypothetical protein